MLSGTLAAKQRNSGCHAPSLLFNLNACSLQHAFQCFRVGLPFYFEMIFEGVTNDFELRGFVPDVPRAPSSAQGSPKVYSMGACKTASSESPQVIVSRSQLYLLRTCLTCSEDPPWTRFLLTSLNLLPTLVLMLASSLRHRLCLFIDVSTPLSSWELDHLYYQSHFFHPTSYFPRHGLELLRTSTPSNCLNQYLWIADSASMVASPATIELYVSPTIESAPASTSPLFLSDHCF